MQDIPLHRILASDLTDTEGAALFLTERLGRKIGVDSVHKFVHSGRLRAYMFQKGQLVPRDPNVHTKGKDLIFLKVHLQMMEPPQPPGNPDIRNLHNHRKKSQKTP